jgi:hypothetical protein
MLTDGKGYELEFIVRSAVLVLLENTAWDGFFNR